MEVLATITVLFVYMIDCHWLIETIASIGASNEQ